MEKSRLNAFVSGRVQGVGFRWWVRGEARKLGLSGWVRNLDDGRVEIVAEGKEDKLTELIELIKESPPSARVDNVEVSWESPTGEFNSFKTIF